MKEQDKVQAKLQQAFNDGFIPKEIKRYMEQNGHSDLGQVWVVEQPDTVKYDPAGKDRNGNLKYKERPVYRIGIGYKLIDDEGQETNHVLIYDQDEIKQILSEL